MKKSTSPRLTLRQLKPAEIPLILPLVKLQNPRMSEARFKANLKDMLPFGYHVVGAFDGKKLVGMSGFWLRTRFWCGRQLDIDNFFVHPDHRSKRIGEQLVAWLEKRALAEKCELIVLDTYADYFLAQRFYYRQGFVSTGYHMTKVPGTNKPFGRCNS